MHVLRSFLFLLRFLLVLFYVFLYKYVWLNFNVKHFSYLGYSYNVVFEEYNYLSYIIVLVPLFFYRNRGKISVFFSAVIYLLAYIPIILSIRFMQNNIWQNNILPIQISLMLAMIMFFYSDRINFGLPVIRLKKIIAFDEICYITCIITVILFIAFRGVMRFVSFDQVYDLRSEAEAIQNSGFNGYLLMWATRVFYPLILLYGLFKNKKKIIFIGFFLFLFSFSLTALKSNLFLPFIMIGMFYTYKYYSRDILLYGLISLLSIMLLLIFIDDSFFLYKAIFFMRTVSISGLLFAIYVDFFAVHDFTYYSHVSFINKVTQSYKYDKDLGIVIGEVYGSNVNAGFWTTDGYAAYGVLGILVISFIVFVFLVFINSITKNIDMRYCILLLIPSLLSLLNASFFTFILSCGVFIIVLYFLLGRDIEFNKKIL